MPGVIASVTDPQVEGFPVSRVLVRLSRIRRRGLGLLVAVAALGLPACQSDGALSLLGYTTRPNYDPGIRTVYVPIFKNLTYRKGLEFDLTRAVVREIEAKTPYKIVSDRSCADSELTGTIISVTKSLLNINQLNEVRQAETTLSVEVVWRDLRAGHQGDVLSHPTRDPNAPALSTPSLAPPLPQVPPEGSAPPPPGPDGTPPLPPSELLADHPLPPPPPPPVALVQSVSTYIPELGQSLTTSFQGNVDRLAIQIVSMMEAPW